MTTFEAALAKFERKNDLSGIEKMIRDAYAKGYVQRLEEEDILRKNKVVAFLDEKKRMKSWYLYNHGAILREDRAGGARAGGDTLDWYQANSIPFCQLPTREEMEELLSGAKVMVRFNIGTLEKSTKWNLRVEVERDGAVITFYQRSPRLHGTRIWDDNHNALWLGDEVDDEKAMAVVFEFEIPKREWKTGDYEYPVKSVRYVETDKKAFLSAHFLSKELSGDDTGRVMRMVEQ